MSSPYTSCPKCLLLFLIFLIFLQKLPIYRKIRSFNYPILLSFLAYRYINVNDSNSSLLSTFIELIKFVKDRTHISSNLFTIIVGDLFGVILLVGLIDFIQSLSKGNLRGFKRAISDWGYRQVRDFSFVKKEIEKEQKKLEESFEKDLKVKSRSLGEINTKLPSKGQKKDDILTLMKSSTKQEDKVWENGLISGAVYHGKHDHKDFLNQCFSLYSLANPLHPDIWPSIMKFDSEIVAMTASLVNNGLETVCGTTSSGGTESIILAIKAHRDYYADRFGITKPELICGISAHAAVDKACDMMNIKLIKVDLDPETYQVDVKQVEKLIGPNTIMMYSSAPSYPHGAIDKIKEMSDLAVKYNIGLHVDCCLGGFILPFAKKLNYPLPDFDFRLPGVTSMSLDTHKYGYALKGTSVVLFRTKELRHAMYFCYADWTGGMYTTPTIAGSRSGGMIAQTWASLMTLGEEGYLQHTDEIFKTNKKIIEGIKGIKELKLLGKNEAMISCFTTVDHSKINIYSVGDQMHKKGWTLNALQNPPCLHLCCTNTHVGKQDKFLSDLKLSVKEVIEAGPNVKGGNAAIYGATAALPPGPVNELLKVYNDVILKP